MNGEARVQLYLELKNKTQTALSQAKQYLAKNIDGMKADIRSLEVEHIKAFKSMKDEVPGLGRAVELATNPYVSMTATVIGLGAALHSASDKAQEFDERMAHANVTANVSKPELAKISDRLLNTAANSTTKGAASAAPDSYNILLSSGMDNATALNAVNPALQAAKAGFTDIETTARAMASSMNSSGMKDANQVLDILFATVNKGNAEFKDIAEYLPKLVPMAQNVGSSFQEVSGAFAYFTAQGINSAKTSTLLENAFKSLADPEKANNFKKLGVDVYDAHGKLKGLYDISTQLNTALHGLTDKQRNTVLGSLGLDVESASAFAIMSNNVKDLKDDIDFTTKSAGQFNQAVENAKTPMDGWVKLSNMADTAWIKIGQSVNNVVLGPLADWLVRNSDTIELLTDMVLGGALAWGTYSLVTNAASIGTGIMTAAQWALNLALTANPIGVVVVAIGALVAGFIYAYQHSEKFRAVLSGIWEVAKVVADVFIGLGKTIMGAFTLDPAMIADGAKQSASAISSIMNGGLSKIYNKGYDSSMSESKAASAKEAADKTNKTATASAPKDSVNLYDKPNAKVQAVLDEEQKKLDKKSKKGGEGSGITGGEHVRNITINKIVFAEKFNSTNAQLSSMNPAELEKWFNEFLQRTILNMVRS